MASQTDDIESISMDDVDADGNQTRPSSGTGDDEQDDDDGAMMCVHDGNGGAEGEDDDDVYPNQFTSSTHSASPRWEIPNLLETPRSNIDTPRTQTTSTPRPMSAMQLGVATLPQMHDINNNDAFPEDSDADTASRQPNGGTEFATVPTTVASFEGCLAEPTDTLLGHAALIETGMITANTSGEESRSTSACIATILIDESNATKGLECTAALTYEGNDHHDWSSHYEASLILPATGISADTQVTPVIDVFSLAQEATPPTFNRLSGTKSPPQTLDALSTARSAGASISQNVSPRTTNVVQSPRNSRSLGPTASPSFAAATVQVPLEDLGATQMKAVSMIRSVPVAPPIVRAVEIKRNELSTNLGPSMRTYHQSCMYPEQREYKSNAPVFWSTESSRRATDSINITSSDSRVPSGVLSEASRKYTNVPNKPLTPERCHGIMPLPARPIVRTMTEASQISPIAVYKARMEAVASHNIQTQDQREYVRSHESLRDSKLLGHTPEFKPSSSVRPVCQSGASQLEGTQTGTTSLNSVLKKCEVPASSLIPSRSVLLEEAIPSGTATRRERLSRDPLPSRRDHLPIDWLAYAERNKQLNVLSHYPPNGTHTRRYCTEGVYATPYVGQRKELSSRAESILESVNWSVGRASANIGAAPRTDSNSVNCRTKKSGRRRAAIVWPPVFCRPRTECFQCSDMPCAKQPTSVNEMDDELVTISDHTHRSSRRVANKRGTSLSAFFHCDSPRHN